jgi:hypothetical protein
MTVIDPLLLAESVEPFEEFLLSLPIGSLFTGDLYKLSGDRFTGLSLEGFSDEPMWLDATSVGRLFMAPDESTVAALTVPEGDDGTPAGVKMISDNAFVQEDDPVTIVAYQDEDGPRVQVDSLHLVRVMLNEDTPPRFCTIALGLMACTAYRHGFSRISLFAGGNGPPPEDLEDGDLIGYFVWPKFGFDATLLPVDLNAAPEHVRDCDSVLSVVEADPEWWEAHGRGREMCFDLAAGSASWKVLLHYLYTVLLEDDDEHQEEA